MHQNNEKSVLSVIFFTIFLDLLGYGILIPIIPLLLADPSSPEFLLPIGYSLKTGYILLGFLTATFPFMQFLATPILGQLSDRYGRKKILAFSLLGTCLSHACFGVGILTKNIPLLFIARAFDGITGASIAVAQAAIADISKPEDRAKNFGLVGMAFGVGFILGPFLGGVFSDHTLVSWFNAATPFWFATLLSAVNIILLLANFKETHPSPNSRLNINWNKSFSNILHAFGLPGLRTFYISTFSYFMGFTLFISFFSVFLINRHGFGQTQIGNYFAYIGLIAAITQGLITRNVAKFAKEHEVLKITFLISALGVFLQIFPHHVWGLILVTPIFGISNGLTFANQTALISRSVGPEIQGEILGINTSIQGLAQSIPPALSGFLASSLSPTAPVVAGSLFMFLAWLIFASFFRQQKPLLS